MQNKSQAKLNYDQLALYQNPQNHLIIYTNGSVINNKIAAAVVVSLQGIIYKTLLSST